MFTNLVIVAVEAEGMTRDTQELLVGSGCIAAVVIAVFLLFGRSKKS